MKKYCGYCKYNISWGDNSIFCQHPRHDTVEEDFHWWPIREGRNTGVRQHEKNAHYDCQDYRHRWWMVFLPWRWQIWGGK